MTRQRRTPKKIKPIEDLKIVHPHAVSLHDGQGRAVAFTDSTIFSTFCVFQPGKIDMLVGLLEWLNHRAPIDPRPWLGLAGVLALCAALWLSRPGDGSWLVLLGSGTCGWAVASMLVAAAGRWAIPLPEPVRPNSAITWPGSASKVVSLTTGRLL